MSLPLERAKTVRESPALAQIMCVCVIRMAVAVQPVNLATLS